MANWQCVEKCGACCQLDPQDRPDLDQYLTPEELDHYLSLVGADGWCIHYNQDNRRCQIYETRPDFCRVQADTFERMFGVLPADLNDFAISCCQEQIAGVYGNGSRELSRFTAAIEDSAPEESHP
ncbi:MAG: YkgJ family cysteine cluster protein [Leptolyngbya sp. SIO1D8]|nr:YkgJ family cysteine cluster protein [Leptolyngbya sp. SIO1D8]